MANKYIRDGAAFNGDGTTPDVAASAGAAGAWNTINYAVGVTPAYGAIVSGDTIYVRSKTAAGADITVTSPSGVTFGPTSGITGTTWVIDDGATWPGIGGVVTCQAVATNENINLRTGNKFTALKPKALRIINNRANYSGAIIAAGVIGIGIEFGYPVKTDTATLGSILIGGSILENCYFTLLAGPWSIANSTAGATTLLINPSIRLGSTAGLSQATGLFSSTVGSTVEILGGSVSGAGAIAAQSLFYTGVNTGSSSEYLVTGLSTPNEMALLTTVAEGAPNFSLRMLAVDKKASASIGASWGYADSRNDGYYPTLSATLPDTSLTPWSWKMKAAYANAYRPAKLSMSKMYTGEDSVKTLTLEMLVSTTLTASTSKANVYMYVQYIDAATGNFVIENTKSTGALDTSTAGWSATTYGAASFDKRKLSLTTAGSAKKDTLVNVMLFVELAGSLANDLYFIDPDPSLI